MHGRPFSGGTLPVPPTSTRISLPDWQPAVTHSLSILRPIVVERLSASEDKYPSNIQSLLLFILCPHGPTRGGHMHETRASEEKGRQIIS